MAAPPSIQQQLATLVGREVKQVRKTDETPPRISVIDTICVITGKDGRHAAEALRDLISRYPEVDGNIVHFKFKGRGQRETPVTDARGIIEVVMLLSGRQAAHVRRQAAELLTRYLGGDLALIEEVCRNRGIQEELAVQNPEDPRRIFGVAVEAEPAGVAVSEQQQEHLARLCTDIMARTLPGMLDKIAAHIDERLAQVETRQRVNLNVRAPKRSAPYARPIVRDISLAGGRPYPVAKFLDEKEREDPTWRDVRRSYSPAFATVVQILKKQKLKEGGTQPIFVEQNHRGQLLYTLQDRPLMEEAWEMTAAHREDLAGVGQAGPRAARAASCSSSSRTRPTVMDLLRGP